MLHGGDVYHISKEQGVVIEELIDFSANINPLGMPESIKTAIVDCLDQVIHYPDPHCSALTAALAVEENVSENYILCGNGAADLIYRICYGLRPKKALLLEPTFLEYRESLSQIDCQIFSFMLDSSFQVTEEAITHLTQEIDILFLCNPNNPTGLLVDLKILPIILQKARENNIIVVMDECFLDFVKNGLTYSMKPYLKEYQNLLLLKSFTKMFALPGIRLGYLLSANEEYLDKIKKAGQTWSVNSLAQAAGVQAIKEKHFVKKTVDYVEKEREYLKENLVSFDFYVYEGNANYIFFHSKKYFPLYELLLNHNIIIRKCSNYEGLTEQYYRIAVRSHKDNEQFVNALKVILRNEESKCRQK